MPSVMAIVSKAVFEKMVSKTVKVGDVVETDRYASTPAVFEQLGKGDAIFLVTVRPPNEALWLVAILEKPAKKGAAWVGAANKTAIRNVTGLVKKLKFASGKGIEAKKGALAMSLQTPRVLTDADVALLRGGSPASAAVEAYREQADLVPAAKKANEQARAAAAAPGGAQRFELANHRRPFDALKKLPKPQMAQLTKMTKANGAGTPAQAVKSEEEWAAMELVDVVEVATGMPVYQLFVWPYGAAELFEHDTTTTVAKAIQHGFELEEEDDLELRKALAAAYATAKPALRETIDFQLDAVKPPVEDKASIALALAAIDRLEKVLGKSKERWRLFGDLTSAQQRAVQVEYPKLVDPLSGDGGSNWVQYAQRLRALGLPPYQSLARWAGIETATPLERQAGSWPVWKWILAVGWGETEIEAAARAIAKELDTKAVSELVWNLATKSDDDDVSGHYGIFGWFMTADGESVGVAYVNRVLRLLGAAIDLSGDDGALAFAKRTQDHFKNNAAVWIASIASYALAHRAKRRKEAFPPGFYPLLHKAGDDISYGLHYDHNIREIVETLPVSEREKLVDDFHFKPMIYECEDKKNGRTVEVPTLIRGWTFIDLIPSAKVMQMVVEDIADTGEKLPKEQLLRVFERFGPAIAPHLEKAIAAKPKNKAFLAQALKAIA